MSGEHHIEHHMGAVIGSSDFKEEYLNSKINKLVEDVEELTTIAKLEPQFAYACFSKAIYHRWTYIQRTVRNIAKNFDPLELAIRENLSPSIIGRKISDLERRLLALPVRLGGLDISDPTKLSDFELNSSVNVTRSLTDIIINQDPNFSKYDDEAVHDVILQIKRNKEKLNEEKANQIYGEICPMKKKIHEAGTREGIGILVVCNTYPITWLHFEQARI